jgi:hypothetical protein
MRLREPQISALLHSALATNDDEISCEELLSVMAVYAEEEARAGSSVTRPALAHLRLCGNCREESEALRSLLRAST